ncbi:hypothetical protein U1Q18_000566 [Sarracenia purpurea var. burkii]
MVGVPSSDPSDGDVDNGDFNGRALEDLQNKRDDFNGRALEGSPKQKRNRFFPFWVSFTDSLLGISLLVNFDLRLRIDLSLSYSSGKEYFSRDTNGHGFTLEEALRVPWISQNSLIRSNPSFTHKLVFKDVLSIMNKLFKIIHINKF